MVRQWIICFFFIFSSFNVFSEEENFLLIDGVTSHIISKMGPHIDTRFSPCSTFKIPLSLMGYDAGVLKDLREPQWDFQKGYDTYLESWKAPQTPQSWMAYSCVWYSKILALNLGVETMAKYLATFAYGNQDMSGGLAEPGPKNPAWINSSLTISPREQVAFLQKMVQHKLLVSDHAFNMTKQIVFKEELAGGWQLFGKTGSSGSVNGLQLSWFVGWIEKEKQFYPFAYLTRAQNMDYSKRIPRVKQLLVETGVLVSKDN